MNFLRPVKQNDLSLSRVLASREEEEEQEGEEEKFVISPFIVILGKIVENSAKRYRPFQSSHPVF